MAALSAARRITARQDNSRAVPVYLADGYSFYDGQVLVIDPASADGYAHPATKKTGLIVVGLLAPKYGNQRNSGVVVSPVSGPSIARDAIVGVFDLDNGTSTDAVLQSDVGATCYLLDDHTVSRLSSGASAAGKIVALNSDGSVQVALLFAGALGD